MVLEDRKIPILGSKLYFSSPWPVRLLQSLLMFLVLGLGVSVICMYMTSGVRLHHPSAIARTNIILPCFDDPLSLRDWMKPPSTLMHQMNDSELLWRASFAPRRKGYPFERVPKIAFMFMTKGPLPLAPLWERFFNGHQTRFSIYLHTLPSYVANFSSKSVFYNRQIPSQGVEWGTMSMCDAERRLLANALLDLENEWFILLSESCIPLHSFNIVYLYVAKSRYSFMGAFDEDSPMGRGRYDRNMQPEIKLEQWRKGPQWFEVNRILAINIVEDTKYYPKFRDFCRPACYSDEHYFPTMLTIQAPHLLANRSVTWTDWSRGGAHPATFGKSDITVEFLKKIIEQKSCLYNNQPTSLCYLFARKFAPSSLTPLLSLSSNVLGY